VKLFGVELSRLFARRAVVSMMVLGTLAVVCVAAGVLYNNRPVSAGDIATAQQEADRYNEQRFTQRRLDTCIERTDDVASCESRHLLQPDAFLYRPQLKPADYDGWLVPMVAISAAMTFLIGATFIGADYSSGSLGTQLLFQPNRWKVWVAKCAAVGVGAAAFTVLALGIANGAILGFASSWDRPIRDGLFGDIAAAGGRGAVLAVAAAVGGLGLVLVARHTAAALGLLALYGVAAEAVVRAVWPGSERWLLSNHVVAFVGGSFKRTIYGQCDGFGQCSDVVYRFSTATATIYLGSALLVVAVVSLLVFVRRDVA
jgi:ABC-2 type transport system permease protein